MRDRNSRNLNYCNLLGVTRAALLALCLPFLMAFVTATPTPAQARTGLGRLEEERAALGKIGGAILVHREYKRLPPGWSLKDHRSKLRSMGINDRKLDGEECALYVHRRLSAGEIARLAAEGIAVNPHVWVPPVPGRHPHGFYLATVQYDSLQRVQDDPRFVRLESSEFLNERHNDTGGQLINIDDVHNGTGVRSRDGSGVNIAVADSGIDTNHGDFPTPVEAFDVTDGTCAPGSVDAAGNLCADPWDTDVRNQTTHHGTHVAGTALGRGTRSGGRYVGAAPGANLYFYKIEHDVDGGAWNHDMVEAINRAANEGCDIFTMSYGGLGSSWFLDGTSDVCQAIDAAVASGMLVFISAGNSAQNDQHTSVRVEPGDKETFQFTVTNPDDAVAYDDAQRIRVIWRDNDRFLVSGQRNIVLRCTNLDTAHGESMSELYSGASRRETESKTYELVPNIAAGGSKTYTFEVENTAACGATPLVHFYRYTGVGTFDNPDPNYTVGHPAVADSAIAVGAWAHRKTYTDHRGRNQDLDPNMTAGQLAPFSSRGPRVDGLRKPDILAPGAWTISCRDPLANRDRRIIDNDGQNLNGSGPADYYVARGTSMACPMAAGAAALLLEAEPSLTPAEVREALTSTAHWAGSPNDSYGAGLIDILAALERHGRQILYVDSRRSGNGSGWSQAYQHLEDAIAAASKGTEIWVAEGGYRPAGRNGSRSATFDLKRGVAIYGGFAGGESRRDQRDWELHRTILSGDLNDNDQSGDLSDNVYHVVTADNVDALGVLDGFTVTGGNADDGPGRGGGLYLFGGQPTIRHSRFVRNTARIYGGGAYLGGDPVIADCAFVENSAPGDDQSGMGGGGAVHVHWSNSPELRNCTFEGNTGRSGGAVYVLGDGPRLLSCAFRNNAARLDGGAVDIVSNSNTPTLLVNCLFTGNSSGWRGGAVYAGRASGAGITSRYTLRMINCTVGGNYATSWNFRGGGLHNGDGTTASVRNCVFWGNTDENSGTSVEEEQVYNHGTACVSINACAIEGWTGGSGSSGADPLFVRPLDDGGDGWGVGGNDDFGDLHLRVGSPCIDAGDQNAQVRMVAEDLDGFPRVVDDPLVLGTNPRIDIGAYEFRRPLFVDRTALSGRRDGSAWAHAYLDLQSALDRVADSEVPVTEIWVAAGTYVPSDATEPGDSRTKTFVIPDGVAVYGHFAGVENGHFDRDLLDPNDETVLSGDIGNAGDDSDNCYHVVSMFRVAEDTLLDGFTVKYGNADGSYPHFHGGGVYVELGSPAIRNCEFQENSADSWGGGLHYHGPGRPTISGCVFSSNTAFAGGALNALYSSLHITTSSFLDNSATYGGGLNIADGDPVVTHCAFAGNSGSFGGGLRNRRASPMLINCLFQDNSASRGGAIYNQENSHASLVNSTIAGNATSGTGGAGIYDEGSNPQITGCILWNNRDRNGNGRSAQILDDASSAAAVSYSCVQATGGSVYPGSGNIAQDPRFADAPNGDLRLTYSSPCIDAGTNDALPEYVVRDLDGSPRYIDDLGVDPDPGNGTAPIVDMGAYEYLADCNGNGTPDGEENDSDGDGLIDDCDGCPNDPNKTEPGACGCGASDVDGDGDGTPDCQDGCPEDPNKTEPGNCGCGVPESDCASYEPVADGSFDRGLEKWKVSSQSGSGPDPQARVENVAEMDNALLVRRSVEPGSEDENPSSLVVSQDLNLSVSASDSVTLSFDILVQSHEFAQYDIWNVYPANVWLDYLDEAGGVVHTVRRSFYVRVSPGHSPDPLPLAELIAPGVWHHRSYDLSSIEPRISRLLAIRIGSEGSGYDVAFDNISVEVSKAESGVAEIDVDGTAEDFASIDYSDDWMEKTVVIPHDPSSAPAARLWIFGQPYNFTGHDFQALDNYRIRVNGDPARELPFDAGELFDHRTDFYQWVSIDIPIGWLLEGANTFRITEVHARDGWNYNNLRVGIDLDNDEDRSRWYGNGETCGDVSRCSGELMIFLDLGAEPFFPSPFCPEERDDDGVPEEFASIDYSDDWMEKTIDVAVDPITVTRARLWVFGQPYNYPDHDFRALENYRIRVNGDPASEVVFDVGLAFRRRTEIYQWVPFDIPVDWLRPGSNTFRIAETHTAEGWVSNNLRVGIDTDRDEDRSRWYGNGETCGSGAACSGELMIFLELCAEEPVSFVRGDCNADRGVDIGDPISLLGYLFTGAATPPCLDSCNVSGDDELDIGDAIYGLSFLFLGGKSPPAPFPDCGPAPTAQTIGCQEYASCP